jgi:hypothetical protein
MRRCWSGSWFAGQRGRVPGRAPPRVVPGFVHSFITDLFSSPTGLAAMRRSSPSRGQPPRRRRTSVRACGYTAIRRALGNRGTPVKSTKCLQPTGRRPVILPGWRAGRVVPAAPSNADHEPNSATKAELAELARNHRYYEVAMLRTATSTSTTVPSADQVSAGHVDVDCPTSHRRDDVLPGTGCAGVCV